MIPIKCQKATSYVGRFRDIAEKSYIMRCLFAFLGYKSGNVKISYSIRL